MRIRNAVLTLAIAMALLVVPGQARAEVTVSITLSGSIEELIPIMQQLKQIVAKGTDAKGEDGPVMKVQMHSITSPSDARFNPRPTYAVPPTAVPKPAPKPALALMPPTLSPGVVAPGTSITVTTEVYDRDHRIDTMSLVIADSGLSFELYDNGTNNDKKARDGVWTTQIDLPEDIAAGSHIVKIMAYDRNGEALSIKTKGKEKGKPLTSETALLIK